jgi:hypothetical protein
MDQKELLAGCPGRFSELAGDRGMNSWTSAFLLFRSIQGGTALLRCDGLSEICRHTSDNAPCSNQLHRSFSGGCQQLGSRSEVTASELHSGGSPTRSPPDRHEILHFIFVELT